MARAPAPAIPKSQSAKPRQKFRTDIQALRAIAVLSVLFYHLWPEQVTGGFVGVDIFFVISGFLITKHLLSLTKRHGRVPLAVFWSKRAKRILPAALLTLFVSTVGLIIWAPLSIWKQNLQEILASTFYAQNWLLASHSVDYSASTNSPSFVQHYWTLSVEEQFYIVLPLIMVCLFSVARSRGTDFRRLLTPCLVLLFVLSLTYSIFFTASTPSQAYFSTFTRAWEFLSGSLIVVFAHRVPRWMRHTWTGWLGVALILFAIVTYSSSTPFPGIFAALPVIGVALVLATQESLPDAGLARVGAWRPISLTGEISYAIYLWHFPLIVLAPFVLRRELSVIDKVAIAVLAFVLAWASTKFFEDPIRFSPRLLGTARPRQIALVSIAAMTVVVLTIAFGTMVFAQRQAQLGGGQLTGPCVGADAVTNSSCSSPFEVTDEVTPNPAMLQGEDGNRDDCWTPEGDATLRVCTLGPQEGATAHVLAVGDSHNNVYLPFYQELSDRFGWQIQVTGKAGCYWTAATQLNHNATEQSLCNEWSQEVTDHVQSSPVPYDYVLTTYSALSAVETQDGESIEDATAHGLADAWASTDTDRTRIIAINDVPSMQSDVISCVEVAGADADNDCSRPRDEALPYSGLNDAGKLRGNTRFIDPRSMLCSDTTCFPVVGNVLAYRDSTHLTTSFLRTLTPDLMAQMDEVLKP